MDNRIRQRRHFLASFTLLTCWALLSLPGAAQAGAWTPTAGSAYQKLGLSFFHSDESFNRQADRQTGFRSFTNTSLVYYGEYGLLNNLTILTSIPLTVLTRNDGAGKTETAGLGDVDLGLRLRLLEGPVVVSTQFLYKLPYFYERHDSLPLGNGQEDVEGRLLLGRSLGRAGYLGLEAGYRYRHDDPSDEFRYLVEYGINPTERSYVRAKLDGVKSISNGARTVTAPGNPAQQNEFDVGKLEISGGFAITKSWFGEATFTPTIYGRNTLTGFNGQLAIVYQF